MEGRSWIRGQVYGQCIWPLKKNLALTVLPLQNVVLERGIKRADSFGDTKEGDFIMEYDVISTGSQGNAVVINREILIDIGVPLKSLKDVYKGLKLVLLTHIHS